MLIDEFLPHYDVTERHALVVRAPLERTYAAARALDLSQSRVTRLLFQLRGMRARPGASIDGLLRAGFVLLAEEAPREFVLGLVGRFWTPGGGLRRVGAGAFGAFNEPGYAKTVWNFCATVGPEGGILLTTETRVLCLDAVSRRWFRLYWILVGPFSGLIRREALRCIRREAEHEPYDQDSA